MSRIVTGAGALIGAGVLAASAFVSTAVAASTTVASTKPTGAPSAAAGPPVRGRLTLYLPDAFFVSRRAVTVPGRRVSVIGLVRPYVAGQSVEVKTFLGRRLIKSDRLGVKRSKRGRYGKFTERVTARGPGPVTVEVAHRSNRAMAVFASRRRFSVLDEHVGPGSTGRFVQLVQQRLLALHVFLPQSGVYDSNTGLALDAYHRLLGWGTSTALDGRTISYLLDGFGAFKVRFPGHGNHAEGDLTHQLLALIHGAKVSWIFPISSGKPSTPTILGDYRVYSRVPGYLPDGMYYSSFFTGGYAIHGYDPAPDYPASHGCMRLPIQDAITVYDWLTFGDWVDTYYSY